MLNSRSKSGTGMGGMTSQRSATAYGGGDKTLYEDLHEAVDVIAGIEPHHYCNIGRSGSQRLMNRALMDCQEYAIVSFWDLDEQGTDKFYCTRFFIIPNPMKRMVIDAEGTVLYQVLYSSPHNNEVFFFFKGYPQSGGDDLDGDGPGKSTKTQVAFVNLTPTQEELDRVGEFRAVDKHCHGFVILKEHGILDEFITTLNTKEYYEQEMLPSPTCIDTVLFHPIAKTPGKTIVFTAFLMENHFSKDWH